MGQWNDGVMMELETGEVQRRTEPTEGCGSPEGMEISAWSGSQVKRIIM